MRLSRFFWFAILATTNIWAQDIDCPAELVQKLKNPQGEIQVCRIVENLYYEPGKKILNAFVVEKIAQHKEHDLEGITVTLWQVAKKDNQYLVEQDYPLYQESQLGESLLEFEYQGQKVKYALVDITRNGHINYIINTFANPMAALVIKSYDPKKRMFENVGYFYQEKGKWIQLPYFISEVQSVVQVKKDRIEIQTGEKKQVFLLKNSRYERQ